MVTTDVRVDARSITANRSFRLRGRKIPTGRWTVKARTPSSLNSLTFVSETDGGRDLGPLLARGCHQRISQLSTAGYG
jgi:hypothetical protein